MVADLIPPLPLAAGSVAGVVFAAAGEGGRGRSSTGVVRVGAAPDLARSPDATTLGRLDAMILGCFCPSMLATGSCQLAGDKLPQDLHLLGRFALRGRLQGRPAGCCSNREISASP